MNQIKANKIKQHAMNKGWKYDYTTGNNICFTRGKDEDLSIWIFKCHYRVHTVLNHPRVGRKDMVRDNIKLQQVYEIIQNPRTHTNKGQYNAAQLQPKLSWTDRLLKKLKRETKQ